MGTVAPIPATTGRTPVRASPPIPRRSQRGAVSVRALLTLIVIAAIVPLAGMLMVTTLSVRESVLQNAHASAQTQANESAAGAAAALGEARRLARNLAARPDIRALDPGRCRAELEPLRGLNPYYANLGSVDAEGQVVCSLLLPAGAPRPRTGNRPWLDAMLRDRQGKIGAPQRGIYTGDWIAVIAEPILDREGALRGAAQVVIKLAAFQSPTPNLIPTGGLTAIVDRQGIVVARSSEPEKWIGRDVSQAPVGKAIVAGQRARAVIMASDGVERLYAFAPIQGSDWVAVSGIPTGPIHQDIRRQEWRNGIVAMLVLALGAFLIWLVHRRIAAPLEGLRRAADAVTRGEGERRVAPEGPAEIRASAQAFNSMLDRLNETEADLRASEARHRLLFETSPDAMRVICDGRLVMINPAAMTMFGFESVEAALGADALDTVAPQARATVREAYRQVTDGREIVRHPGITFTRRDGSEVHAEVILLPFVFSGRPAVLSVLHDLTRQRADQQRIERLAGAREALARVDAAAARASGWDALCEATCRIVVESIGVVACLVRMADPARHELRRIALHGGRYGKLGSVTLDTRDSPHPAARAFREGRAVRMGDPAEVEGLSDAQRAWNAQEGVRGGLFIPITGASGRPIGVFSLFAAEPDRFDADVEALIGQIAVSLAFAHDKLGAEADLRASEERFRALTAMSSDWYWETDAQHRFTRVSLQEHARNHFAPTESMIGRTRWDSGLLEYDPEAMARHRMALMRHEPFRDFETRRRDATGNIRFARISGEPMFSPDGTFAGYRGVGRDITEARAAQEAQLAAERQYRLLFDAMPAAVSVVSDGRVVMANTGAIELFGCGSEAATLGRDVFDTIAPEYHAKARERIARVVERGETVHTEDLEVLRADGSRVWAELVMHPFEYKGLPAIVRIVRDNTSRRAARMRILQLAEMKGALSDTIEAMLRARDWKAMCTRVCDIAARRAGLVGAQIRMFDPESRTLDVYAMSSRLSAPIGADSIPVDAPDLTVAEAFRSGRRVILHDMGVPEAGRVTPQARARFASLEVGSRGFFPVKANGQVVAQLLVLARETGYFSDEICGVLEEMADNLGFAFDKLRAEEALAETEERHRTLIEVSGNGILVLDGTRIEFANPAFVRLLAFASSAETTGVDVLDLVDDRDRRRARDNLAQVGSGAAGTIPPGPLRLVTREGQPRIARVSATAIHIRGRRLIQVEVHDVTIEQNALAEVQALNRSLEQRVAQRTAELTEANRDLESFAYSVAHDLRAPLRSMSGFAQLLKLDLEDGKSERLGVHVLRITDGARRMGQLIDGLLRVARVSREQPSPEPLDFGALVGDVLAECGARERARVSVDQLPVLHADAALMKQVWANLVSNALKYSAGVAEPDIRIEYERTAGECVFHVRDNGVGFDPATAGRLFEVFHRLHRADEFEGTGIGLAIVRRIVERHGGRVWAHATPGRGATFSFALPATLAVQPEAAAHGMDTAG